MITSYSYHRNYGKGKKKRGGTNRTETSWLGLLGREEFGYGRRDGIMVME